MKVDRTKLLGFSLIVSSLLLLAAYLSGYEPLTERAKGYVDKGIKSTLASYVVIRGINAGVSVLKESELFISPAGLGVSVAFGQVLDPIDDITERASAVMLLSFVSLGIQKLIVSVFSGYITLLASLLALLSGVLILLRLSLSVISLQLFLAVVVLKFLIPLMVLGTDLIYEAYIGNEVNKLNAGLGSIKLSLLEVAKSVSDPGALRASIERLRISSDNVVESLMALSLYFIFQTIVLPIAGLWLTLKLSIGAMRLGSFRGV